MKQIPGLIIYLVLEIKVREIIDKKVAIFY